MRVLINAASAGLGGALTYIINILSELPGLAQPNDKFFLVIPASKLRLFEKIARNSLTKLIPYSHKHALQRLYLDNVIIPKVANEVKADVLYSSTGFGTLRVPCPQVLLVRNASFFCPVFQRKYMEINASLTATRLRRLSSLLSIRSADVLVFPSRAMRDLVASCASISNKRTEVIHYGFSPHNFFPRNSAKPEAADKIERWRDENYKILLNVSHYAVHKNFETLIEALPELLASGQKVKLVCTLSDRSRKDGSIPENNSLYVRCYDSLMARQRELGLSDTVIHTGHFDHDQLHYLYERADAFIFPSFTESFGHPLVEAMSCGLPVVAADTAVNRESVRRGCTILQHF